MCCDFPLAEAYIPDCSLLLQQQMLRCQRLSRKRLVFADADTFLMPRVAIHGLARGFEQMDQYVELLDKIGNESGIVFGYYQRLASGMMRRSIAPKLFGNDFEKYVEAIRKR